MGSAIFADGALAGRAVLITGGGIGLGSAAAAEVRRCGAEVVIRGRSEEVLKAAAEELDLSYVAAPPRCASTPSRSGAPRPHRPAPAPGSRGRARLARRAVLLSAGRRALGSVVTLDMWLGPWPPPGLRGDEGTVPTEARGPKPAGS